MSFRAAIIPVTPFQQNCSLIWDDASGRGAVVDPGGDLDLIRAQIQQHGVTLEKILLTHGHLDHCSGAGELAVSENIPIEGPHREDAFWIDQLPAQTAKFGFPPPLPFTPDRWLDGGDTVTIADHVFAVRFCPGHTPGHVIFFQEEARLALVGDVLFRGSIGRTDFPRGDHATLIRSIREQLWPLGNDVTFSPGHGSMSTFGEERQTNPFVADALFAAQGEG